jgi:hypothetical protein
MTVIQVWHLFHEVQRRGQGVGHMRKDVLVRLAGLAIMLTLISSALVSGTYAKYASAVSGSDTVRVAKFAFNLTDKTGAVVGSQSVGAATFDIFSTTDDGLYEMARAAPS